MHLDVTASFRDARVFDLDPNEFEEASARPTTEAMMGDIVATADESVKLNVTVAAHAAVERIEIRNGSDLVRTFRPYSETELGRRFRVLWSGAEYRGRGRNTWWQGRAVFSETTIDRIEKINSWNHERRLEVVDASSVEFEAITTGNYGGFDVWVAAGNAGSIEIETNHGSLELDLATIDIDDQTMEAGGLERRLKVFRLPDNNPYRDCTFSTVVPLAAGRDNPLWVSVFTEDGHQAWSSPIFAFDSFKS